MKDEQHIVSPKPPQAASRRVRDRKQATGNWNPAWEPFAKLDPAWTEKAIAMAISPAVAGALDAKTIELIGIALDVSFTLLYAPGVRRHIPRAQHVRRRPHSARGAGRSRAARRLTFVHPTEPDTTQTCKGNAHELSRRIPIP